MKIADIYKIDNTQNYGYCAVIPDIASAGEINAFIKSIGIEGVCDVEKLHSTLMYDSSDKLPHDMMVQINKPDVVYDDIEFDDIIVLGSDCTVITYKSQKLHDRFKELSKYMKHSFDDIILHITVVQSEDEEAAKAACATLKARKEEIFELLKGITLSNEYFEPLKT